MKIAYVITRGDSIGGAQIHVRDLASHASQLHDVCVFAGYQGETDGPLACELAVRGVPHHALGSMMRQLAPGHDLAGLRELVIALRRFGPDLICAHSSKAGILARLAGRWLGVPTTFTAHSWAFVDLVPRLQRGLYRAIERSLAPLADRLICVAEADRRFALRHGVGSPERFVTIHNGIPTGPHDPLARPADGPVTIAMVARLEPGKNHTVLLDALLTLPDIHLALIGDGVLRPMLEQYVAERGLCPRVRFWGHRNDVAECLAAAHIFALPSLSEGFPLSVLEAMRAGLPVVASDVGGIGEAVEEGVTGHLVQAGDVVGLRTALAGLAADPDRRVGMGQAGRERFLREFTFERMATRTYAVYDEILAQRRHSLASAARG